MACKKRSFFSDGSKEGGARIKIKKIGKSGPEDLAQVCDIWQISLLKSMVSNMQSTRGRGIE